MTSPVLRRGLTLGGLGIAAAISARSLLRPLPDTDRRLLDWDAVRRVAHGRTGESPSPRLDPALGPRYDSFARELAPFMQETCGEVPSGFPNFTVLSRRGFIDTNIVLVRRMVTPLEELREQIHESRTTRAGRTVASRYLGELLGFVSQRVLGQYDPVLALGDVVPDAHAALYLVEPNVIAYQRAQNLPGESLRRWLILHELTHAWQFGAHPWLRVHITALMQDLILTGLERDGGRVRVAPASRFMIGLPALVRSRLSGISRIQATMSLLEGYSDFVMERVGRAHLDRFDELERAYHRRRQQRSALERLVLAVTGLRAKLQQYEIGKRFSVEVADSGGVQLLNRVWDGPEFLPTMAELRDPARWIRRQD